MRNIRQEIDQTVKSLILLQLNGIESGRRYTALCYKLDELNRECARQIIRGLKNAKVDR